MNWHKRLNAMLKFWGINKEGLSKISGHTYQSVRAMTQPSKELSRRFKDMIIAHEKTLARVRDKLYV